FSLIAALSGFMPTLNLLSTYNLSSIFNNIGATATKTSIGGPLSWPRPFAIDLPHPGRQKRRPLRQVELGKR
ncbi:MAG: hypothetical protein WAM62_02245, partial [Pseudolabrys sp.]